MSVVKASFDWWCRSFCPEKLLLQQKVALIFDGSLLCMLPIVQPGWHAAGQRCHRRRAPMPTGWRPAARGTAGSAPSGRFRAPASLAAGGSGPGFVRSCNEIGKKMPSAKHKALLRLRLMHPPHQRTRHISARAAASTPCSPQVPADGGGGGLVIGACLPQECINVQLPRKGGAAPRQLHEG